MTLNVTFHPFSEQGIDESKQLAEMTLEMSDNKEKWEPEENQVAVQIAKKIMELQGDHNGDVDRMTVAIKAVTDKGVDLSEDIQDHIHAQLRSADYWDLPTE
jgi:rRNA maturation endonuclease Nob1